MGRVSEKFGSGPTQKPTQKPDPQKPDPGTLTTTWGEIFPICFQLLTILC